MGSKFYITTPIYYVNAKPHIGHSYTTIAADTLSRFYRLKGYDVFFLTGTDEHGEKIEKATLERGFKPGEEKRFVDEIVLSFKDLWNRLTINYDHFIRTTDPEHEKTVQALLQKLYDGGKIYKKVYKGWFCTPCETFWQAETSDTTAGICPDCKRPLERLDEENYFFKTSEYQVWLIDYIKSHPDFIQPSFRKNEVLGFLNEPLLDLCISRSKSRMSWGIEIPFDRNFVVYVWFDALINYISGIGYPNDMERFSRYWPCDIHCIGKDILRHHAVYWPIMLHAAGIEPPNTVFAHGWWIIKGEKMSKSKGNIVDPLNLVDQYGIDAFRYFLLREVPFGLDGVFNEDIIIRRYNADLANDLGNLVNRTLTMVEKYHGGMIRRARAHEGLKAEAMSLSEVLDRAMLHLDFAGALTKIWALINTANKAIEDSKPWNLAKEKKDEELASLLYSLLEVLRIVSIAIYPCMPHTAQAIYAQLGIDGDVSRAHVSDITTWEKLVEGVKVKKAAPLFPRREVA